MTATPPLFRSRLIYVDLDGTLTPLDSLWEGVARLARRKPLHLALLPFSLLRGRAWLKSRVAQFSPANPVGWPWNEELLASLKQARQAGAKLVLATAAHRSTAQAVCQQLGLFDDFLATDEQNLSGQNKAQAICHHAAGADFAYAGDHGDRDLPVWNHAQEVAVVTSDAALKRKLATLGKPLLVFPAQKAAPLALLRLLRPHQWVKNVLLFVPLGAAHQLQEWPQLAGVALAFVAMCLVASAGYLANDLLDLEADRFHPEKRNRPLASGAVSLPIGLILFLACLAGATLLSQFAPPALFLLLMAYLLLSMSYSFFFKRKLMLDVTLLAGLYTLRILMGGLVIDLFVSPWLLAFSIFLFLSLALAKRAGELLAREASDSQPLPNRAYQAEDLDVLLSLGPASGLMAVTVLALYISNEATRQLYRHLEWLWLVCPVLIYWTSRLWFKTRRGQLSHDPVLFALRDPASYLCAGTIALLAMLAI
jgi:4-hydroxybenzoate polyprenyltransferase/phosphoserine phosphatase